jgi:NADH-quinone oxidoreductase subunit N
MNLSYLYSELGMVGLMLGVLLADLFLPKLSRRRLTFACACGLLVILAYSFYSVILVMEKPPVLARPSDVLVLDPLSQWFKPFAIFATLISAIMSLQFFKPNEEYFAEFLVLLLAACLAMMILGSAQDLFTLFVALELLTITFYILVAFQRKDAACLESGLKYLIYGAFSSGIMLYGITLLFGITGEFRLSELHRQLELFQHSAIIKLAILLVWVGLAFKLAAFPFHWWAPDVYEGAPTPTVALLSTGSKAAGIVVTIRFLFEAIPPVFQSFWIPLVIFSAAGSIIVGNLSALSWVTPASVIPVICSSAFLHSHPSVYPLFFTTFGSISSPML